MSVDNGGYYFNDREEQAVLDYNQSTTKEERDVIFNAVLREPLEKMCEIILKRYKSAIYTGGYDLKEVQDNAISHLIENMRTYNPNMLNKLGYKVKAYSYLQTIVRNYYRNFSKKLYKESKRNLCYDDCSDDVEENSEYTYELKFEEETSTDIFLRNVIGKIEHKIKNDNSLKDNEIIVGNAIVNILNNWSIIFLEETPEGRYQKKITNKFTKNKIILFLKEQTNLQTKDIRSSLKPYKELYFLEKKIII